MEISIKRVSYLSAIGFVIVFTLACASSGCVTVEVDDHDPDCGDVIVVVEPGDPIGPDPEPEPEPEPEAARLDLVFGGPPAGTELAVGAQNADVLCFDATATEEMEIRNTRIEITSGDGLIINSMPQYRDIKVVDTGTGQAMAGPTDVRWDGSEISQDLVLIDVWPLHADETRTFCIRLDVNGNARLDGNSLYMKLLPFEAGDVVLTGDGSELPPPIASRRRPPSGRASSWSAGTARWSRTPRRPSRRLPCRRARSSTPGRSSSIA